MTVFIGRMSASAGASSENPSGSDCKGAAGASDQPEQDNANFECNICLDTAKDAVVSMCGHLFW